MILVDTHAVMWLTHDQAQLSHVAASTLAKERSLSRLVIADVTLLEIAVALQKGRTAVSASIHDYLRFVESIFAVLPVTSKVAERAVRFGAAYPRDPADRLIGATAVVHGLKLVTRDTLIRKSGEVDCVW